MEKEWRLSSWMNQLGGIIGGQSLFYKLERKGAVTDWRQLIEVPVGGSLFGYVRRK